MGALGEHPCSSEVRRRAGFLMEGAAAESLVKAERASGPALTNQPHPHFLAAPRAGSDKSFALRDLAANQSPH